MKNWLILIICFLFVKLVCAQDLRMGVQTDFRFGIAKADLPKVKTLKDINDGYPSSWIKGYLSVETKAIKSDGTIASAFGKNDVLTQDQLDLINRADYGTRLSFHVKYQPDRENNECAEIKEVNFIYTVIPEKLAEYIGGQDSLRAYIKENAIDKISKEKSKAIEMANVSFAIGKQGQIIDVKITESTSFPDIDNLLINVVKKMPKWKPAQNEKGQSIIQNFELNIGTSAGC